MTSHEQHLISVLCPAIQSRNHIRFWYQNRSGRKEWRSVEPYLIGAFPQRHIQLSAWLLPTAEQIQTGQQESWRSYTLKNISEVQILDTQFETMRPDYDPLGNGMKEIFCSLEKEVRYLKIV